MKGTSFMQPDLAYAMSRLPKLLAAAAALALAVGCVVAPYPYVGYPTATTVATPPSFDRSWNAALDAAGDIGLQITSADRARGRITGTKAGALVTVDLRQHADNSLHVTFTAPDSKGSSPSLHDHWQTAYNRRMGR
jgi:hypothetical protein